MVATENGNAVEQSTRPPTKAKSTPTPAIRRSPQEPTEGRMERRKSVPCRRPRRTDPRQQPCSRYSPHGRRIEAEIQPFRVKSTLENLKTALGGEQQEIDSLYPEFLVHATSQLETTPCVPFLGNGIRKDPRPPLPGRRRHHGNGPRLDPGTARLLRLHLCGYTAKTQEADNCPACNFVWERFEVIR